MFRSLESESTSLILLGVLAIIVGIIAIAWPGVTILALVILFAVYAFIGGIAEIVAGFQGGETAGTRAMFILAGLVSVAFGVCCSPVPASVRSPWRCCSACSA